MPWKRPSSNPSASPIPNAALNLLSENKFDLVFLDVDMPGMTGFELCTKLRALPQHKKTPVVFVTALSDFDSRTSSMMAGGNDFIAKPFLFIELTVKALIHVLRARLQPAEVKMRPDIVRRLDQVEAPCHLVAAAEKVVVDARWRFAFECFFPAVIIRHTDLERCSLSCNPWRTVNASGLSVCFTPMVERVFPWGDITSEVCLELVVASRIDFSFLPSSSILPHRDSDVLLRGLADDCR